MRKFFQLYVVMAIVVIIGISACTPKTDATEVAPVLSTEAINTKIAEMTQAATASSEVQATDAVPVETAVVDVQALILEKLQNHHSIDRVLAAQKTREEWNATLDRMIGYGAKISEEEKQIIIDYLLSRSN